ncbi:hypothetical protein [Streptomyces nodosus]|uniref:RHS repeat-associated core domain-containing protein n=1 Tax=Streptomyces nodosus TaxID=40318 RepID=A0A0B5DL72_9ACTN|nr:hypothetical protein [Streptomyces nodosus]AJE44498.1 hypothetical protein SNOD_34400 [Streptomyces nodosus]MBB4796169.1 hypothetical protein [Streptomyces nodosus]QEV42987.1 hypothetical protein CP978_34640 [Streptomyces nodosus]
MDQHQSLNGYAYADNSPVTFSDPTGLKKGGGLGALLGLVGGVIGAVLSTVGAIISSGVLSGSGGGGGKTGTATTTSTGTTQCHYAMGMNQCTTTGPRAPAMTDNSANTGNSCTGSGYPACPGLIGDQGNPEIIKELLLIGCGWIPVVGAACDGYDFKRSVDDGDMVGSTLGAIGFIPLVGDFLKVPGQLKDLERIADVSRAAKTRPIVKWSTPDYDGWGHVLDNHRTSGKGYAKDPDGKGVFEGKFVKGEKLKKRIQEAVGKGKAMPNTKGRDGVVYEYNFGPGNVIGRLSKNDGGGVSTGIRVILGPDGSLRTAHPI